MEPTEQDRALLAAYLADRDVRCPRCQYNLRGAVSGRCPECGDALRLQVGLVEPRIGAWVSYLAAACLGLGGSLLFGGIALMHAPKDWWWEEPGAWLLILQFVLTAIMLRIALTHRSAFRALPHWRQRVYAVSAWTAVLILSAFVVIFFDD